MAERRPGRPRKATTHSVQAAVEGVPLPAEGEIVGDGRKVEFLGATFRMADRIGLMPLLRFAHASSKGLDSTDMEGLVALYDMIHDCIDVEEWDRFQRHAIDTKAEADDLMAMVQKVIETLTARPTTRPGDSSAGPRTTTRRSYQPTFRRTVPLELRGEDGILQSMAGRRSSRCCRRRSAAVSCSPPRFPPPPRESETLVAL